MSRASLLAAALVVLGLASAPGVADRGGFVIRSFHTDLVVKPDADLLVEETLEVEFTEPRHGIYRTIPVRYTDPRGFAYSLGFTLLGVRDAEGRPHAVKQSSQGAYVKLRIGDADRTVSGPVTYVVSYRIRGAVGHFADHDELYWNATGHEWQTRIERSSATILLPGPVADEALELAGYTGRFGSRERDVTVVRRGETTAGFSTNRPLAPLEGLTVVAAWPHGLVRFPGPVSRAARFLADNPALPVPLLALAGLYALYRRRGRDPEGRGSVVVRYEPPEGVSPAELGAIVDERVDLRDITATVVDLAVRGHLVIRVESESTWLGLSSREVTVFERLDSPAGDDLRRHERLVLDGLFEEGPRVGMDDLENRFYKHLPRIRRAVYQHLTEEGRFAGHPQHVRRRYVLLGVLAGGLTFAAGFALAAARGVLPPQSLVVPAVAGVATLAVFAAFAPAMPRKTVRGVHLAEWAKGFEEFVERVEAERLERDRARNVFEALLPYAMALGVASAWARRFEGIYAQAGDARHAWFVGGDPSSRLGAIDLHKAVDAAMTRAGHEMTAAPRSSGSSGSGGGGFSGGGGGGGGGGSW